MSVEKKLLQFQSEVEAVKKDSKNPFFKSNYVDINGILKAIQPTLEKCGLSYSQCPNIDENGNDVLVTKVYDADKPESFIQSITRLIMAKKDMQQYGSAITYARRYALQSMLGLEAEDDDANLATHGSSKPTKKQPTKAPAKAQKETASDDDWN